jgi:hypothetical protein
MKPRAMTPKQIKASVYADILFSKQSLGPGGEFQSTAPMLRTVAALNPGASREEFVEACVAAGYRANTAANRFRESRKFDCEETGMTTDANGRLLG